jgi:rubrerythrin
MKTYICEICGDAYLGEDRPSQCPFCGADENFIQDGDIAHPVILGEFDLSEKSRENLYKTLELETRASALYECMASRADSYEIKAMYKRLSKVEKEHASLVSKILKIEMPEIKPEDCSGDDIENFNETIKLEERASGLYHQFMNEATEEPIQKAFNALERVEKGHIDLIKRYL